MADIERTIFVRRSSNGFAVTVEPPVEGFDFDKDCPTYKEARTFARGVRLYRGFLIDDRTGEKADG